MAEVLLITGTCGSGKSTVAALLAERHGWIRISEDDLWHEKHHRQRGDPGSPGHLVKRRAIREVVVHRVGSALARERNVVVDATIHEQTPDSLMEYADLLTSADVKWVLRVLHPRLEVAVLRDASRSGWRAGANGVESLWRKFSGTVFEPQVFLDTSEDTPEETVTRVLDSLSLHDGRDAGRSRSSARGIVG